MSIAVPIMLGMASQNLLNLVDTAFVGRLGEDALAAVGMGGFANWLVVAFLIGLGSGVQATASRRLGEGKRSETASGLNAALVVAVVIGVPVAWLGIQFAEEYFALLNGDPAVRAQGGQYLAARFVAVPFVAANFSFRGFWNGTNRSLFYMSTLVAMHAVNIFLDYALIFGAFGFPEMGVAGAGYATSISLMFGTLIYVVLAWVQARREGFMRLDTLASVMPRVLRLSVPAGLQQVLFSGGFVVFYVIAGKVGTDALAASTVIINLLLVCVLPAVGLGLTGASLVGQALGAEDVEEARRWGWSSAVLGSMVMGVLGMTLAIGARFWLRIFIPDDPHIVEMAALPLMVVGAFQAIDGVGVVLLNVLVGIGDTMAALRINLFAQWIVFLPTAYVFSVELGFGLIALWAGMSGYRLLLAILTAWRFHHGAWTRAEA